MKRISALLLVFAFLLTCMIAGGTAFAEGGAFLDDFRITNDGKETFSDNFDDGSIADWVKKYDTIVTCARDGSCMMHMNKHHYAASTAYHSVPIGQAGLVELVTRVRVTQAEEQFDIRQGNSSVLSITLYAGSSDARAAVDVYLTNPGSSCSIGLSRRNPNGSAMTHNTALSPGNWYTLMFRMDPSNGKMTALLDGKPVANLAYDPEQFKSIREVGLCCSFGDGQARDH